MITVRDLQELLDKLPEDMPIYWVVDGKVPVFKETTAEDVPMWITNMRHNNGTLYRVLGMHSPTYIKRNYEEGLAQGGAISLYNYGKADNKE